MKEFYKKFKALTGYNAQDMADKVGVSKQHIHASMGNHSMIYKTSVAAIMSICIDDKISELKKHIEELESFKKEVMINSIENGSEFKEGENEKV